MFPRHHGVVHPWVTDVGDGFWVWWAAGNIQHK
jgi:hypothetical protein